MNVPILSVAIRDLVDGYHSRRERCGPPYARPQVGHRPVAVLGDCPLWGILVCASRPTADCVQFDDWQVGLPVPASGGAGAWFLEQRHSSKSVVGESWRAGGGDPVCAQPWRSAHRGGPHRARAEPARHHYSERDARRHAEIVVGRCPVAVAARGTGAVAARLSDGDAAASSWDTRCLTCRRQDGAVGWRWPPCEQRHRDCPAATSQAADDRGVLHDQDC